MIYENSPFRTKMRTKEDTFDEGLQNQLLELFPGYEFAEDLVNKPIK